MALNARERTVLTVAFSYLSSNLDDVNDAFATDGGTQIKVDGKRQTRLTSEEVSDLARKFDVDID